MPTGRFAQQDVSLFSRRFLGDRPKPLFEFLCEPFICAALQGVQAVEAEVQFSRPLPGEDGLFAPAGQQIGLGQASAIRQVVITWPTTGRTDIYRDLPLDRFASIREGNLDDIDLSGINMGLVNLFPSNLTSGNWKFGIVVSENASDKQFEAIGRIMSGQEGGIFADFAGLVGENLGVERGEVTFSDGDQPTGSISGSSFTFEPLPGPEGSDAQTTVRNAAFGFAPEFRVGRAAGHSDVFDIEYDGVYAEAADFEFASEMDEGAATGRG